MLQSLYLAREQGSESNLKSWQSLRVWEKQLSQLHPTLTWSTEIQAQVMTALSALSLCSPAAEVGMEAELGSSRAESKSNQLSASDSRTQCKSLSARQSSGPVTQTVGSNSVTPSQ
eukprot:32643-Rhodomonas_salina.1